MNLIRAIKEHVWLIVGGAALLVAALFLRDANTEEVIKSFLRRKLVEDEVAKLKESLAKEDANLASNEEKLTEAAEAMKAAKINVKTASDAEVVEFYKKHLNK